MNFTDLYHGTTFATWHDSRFIQMSSSFPFPPPAPPGQSLGWSGWALVAATIALLVFAGALTVYFPER